MAEQRSTGERLDAVERALGGVMQETSALRSDVDALTKDMAEQARRLSILTPMVIGIATSQEEIRSTLARLVAGQDKLVPLLDATSGINKSVSDLRHTMEGLSCLTRSSKQEGGE